MQKDGLRLIETRCKVRKLHWDLTIDAILGEIPNIALKKGLAAERIDFRCNWFWNGYRLRGKKASCCHFEDATERKLEKVWIQICVGPTAPQADCLARAHSKNLGSRIARDATVLLGMSLKSVHEYRWIKEVLQHQGYIIHPMVSTCFLWIVALVISCFFLQKVTMRVSSPCQTLMCWWRISMYASVCVSVCVCFQIVGTTAQPLLHSAIFLCDPLPQPRFLSPLPVRTECYRDSNLTWFLQTLWLSEPILTQHATTISYPIGSMYAIYGNIYHQYTPVMLAYIPAPRILWVYHS